MTTKLVARRLAASRTQPTEHHTRPGPKVVTDEHKEAMAEGRREAAALRRYLEALAAPAIRPRRSEDQLQAKIAEINTRLVGETMPPLRRLALIQERNDLTAELELLAEEEYLDPDDYVDDFIELAAGYSQRKSISYKAWREVGVPAAVLTKAGIHR